MITLHIEADHADQLRHEALSALGIDPRVLKITFNAMGLPTDGTPVAAQAKVDEVFEPGATVVTTGGGVGLVIETDVPPLATEAPKRRTRKPAEPKPDATKPSTQNVGDELEPPAFLDRRPEATTEPAATTTASTATPTLEELREHLSKLLAAKGSNPKVVFDLIGKYKQADGTACAKASQVADGDRAALIADITAELAKK